MSIRGLAVTLAVLAACGDDGVHHLPDAPPIPIVKLSVTPATLTIATGETLMVTATVERLNFEGDVTVTAVTGSNDLTVSGGTIPAGATTLMLIVSASSAASSKTLEVAVPGNAGDGIPVAAGSFDVTIAGRAGVPIGGELAGDRAGSSVALSADGKRVIIGAPFNDATGADAGQARVYDRSGNTWTQIGADLDGEAAGDRYGSAVAISSDGMRVAVGAYLNDGGGGGAGHVRVFELVGTTWTQLGADIDGTNGAELGASLALSASGSRIVIGAPSANNVNGNAYVYDYTGGAWVLAGAAIPGDRDLGTDVDISDDGNRIAIGQPSSSGADTYAGRVTVYEWSGTAWTQLGGQVVGLAPDGFCGGATALSADGATVVLGCNFADTAGTNSGEVVVFRYAGAWTQLGAALVGLGGSQLGTSVSISGDGTKILVGGPTGAGVARLYTLVQSAWVLAAGPDLGAGSFTGAAVSLSADGKTAGVGAPYADQPTNQSGAVRLYDLP